jgi:RNA polymerase sigma factor (TIGR02999 family)
MLTLVLAQLSNIETFITQNNSRGSVHYFYSIDIHAYHIVVVLGYCTPKFWSRDDIFNEKLEPMNSPTIVSETGTITEWLIEARGGNEQALDGLIKVAYPELRRLARHYMGLERPDHTLQPTALVHEAYLRLVGGNSIDYCNHKHFFAAAARVMRNLLVDHARARLVAKRHSAGTIHLDEALNFTACGSGDFLELEAALKRLSQFDDRQGRVVELRYFGGLTNAEIASLLGISERTVKREWRMAKAWLYNQVRGTR